MTPVELIAFEQDIADCFRRGEIKAPIHLSGGNEEQLIEIFNGIRPADWVLCGWRSHYHCLLKGVPPDILKKAILGGRSVALCFPEYRILCSGIVGGIAPIAVGLAYTKTAKVHCFLGDMSARAGVFYEAMCYASGHDLPVRWIVEDNGKSVCTDTKASWGRGNRHDIKRYEYELPYPHSGIGEWVAFK